MGQRVKAALDKKDIKASTVAHWLKCDENNVYKLFNKAVWDTYKLEVIIRNTGLPATYFLIEKEYLQHDAFSVVGEHDQKLFKKEILELRAEVDRLKSELVKSKDKLIAVLEKNSNSASAKSKN